MPSTRISSSVGASCSGATRTERTRPATFTRSRQRGLGDRDAAGHATSPSALGVAGGRARALDARGPRRCAPVRRVTMADSGTRSVVAGIEVERHRGDVGVGQPRELLEERVGGLVVQHPVPDAAVLAVGEEDRHLGLAVGELADHALHRRADEPAVGGVDDLERHALEPGARPLLGQLRGGLLVEREVHGPQLVGRERAGVLDRPGRGHVEAVDEHEHDVAPEDRRGGGGRDVVLEQLLPRARTGGSAAAA